MSSVALDVQSATGHLALLGERVMIIGRRGYIGRVFTEYAIAQGAEVISLSSEECDLLNTAQVCRHFASIGPGPYTVVCCAVINKPDANTYEAFLNNIKLVRNLAEGCRIAKAAYIVHLSSVDVYGRRPESPITERTRLKPDSWYALAKAVGEWILLSGDELHCPVTVLRLPGIYGPDLRDHSVIGRMVNTARRDRIICYSANERVLRDYVYVKDLCRLVGRFITLRHHGVVNVATGTSYELGEIAGKVAKICGGAKLICDASDEARSFDLRFDTQALRECVPGFVFTTLADGIRSYLKS